MGVVISFPSCARSLPPARMADVAVDGAASATLLRTDAPSARTGARNGGDAPAFIHRAGSAVVGGVGPKPCRIDGAAWARGDHPESGPSLLELQVAVAKALREGNAERAAFYQAVVDLRVRQAQREAFPLRPAVAHRGADGPDRGLSAHLFDGPDAA